MKCRHCYENLEHVFIDLGFAPPSNDYLGKDDLIKPLSYYPLRVLVCDSCWLVQTEDYLHPQKLFRNDYSYLSSTSNTWLQHAKEYVNQTIKNNNLTSASFVIEIASNDGYLLTNFINQNIPCLGIEPTESTANISKEKGVDVISDFFSSKLAMQIIGKYKKANIVCGNNVYAHVPDINDFTEGLKILLTEDGIINLEFPHLLNLLENNLFDTIYHEHYSYLSLTTVVNIFSKHDLKIYDIDILETHGGSLRIYGCHIDNDKIISQKIITMLDKEKSNGLLNLNTYRNFQRNAEAIKNNFLIFLIHQKLEGKSIAAFGAAAKGNTLLNYAGIKNDLIDFVCDAAVAKQGKLMPGSMVPIFSPSYLYDRKPDIVIIFPWNIKNEIIKEHSKISNWGGQFVIVTPKIQILS